MLKGEDGCHGGLKCHEIYVKGYTEIKCMNRMAVRVLHSVQEVHKKLNLTEQRRNVA